MPYRRWTGPEIVIVVYFASRNAGHEGCRKILNLKTAGQFEEPRTTLSIRNKLDDIRKIDDLWSETKGWNITAVDEWLVALDVENLHALVEAGYEELQLVPEENRQAFLHAALAPTVINGQ